MYSIIVGCVEILIGDEIVWVVEGSLVCDWYRTESTVGACRVDVIGLAEARRGHAGIGPLTALRFVTLFRVKKEKRAEVEPQPTYCAVALLSISLLAFDSARQD